MRREDVEQGLRLLDEVGAAIGSGRNNDEWIEANARFNRWLILYGPNLLVDAAALLEIEQRRDMK